MISADVSVSLTSVVILVDDSFSELSLLSKFVHPITDILILSEIQADDIAGITQALRPHPRE